MGINRRLGAGVILWVLMLGTAVASSQTTPATNFQAVTDQITYDAGSEVKVRISGSPQAEKTPVKLVGIVRYENAGEPGQGDMPAEAARTVLFTASEPPRDSVTLWKIPASAPTGRYDVDLAAVDPASGSVLHGEIDVASFSVHRKLVRIDRIRLDKTFYTSGDAVQASVDLVNLTGKPLRGLRVEFSDRYWPWIAGPADQAKASIVPLAASLDLPGQAAARTVRGDQVAIAPQVPKPTLHQYGVVVWDHDRKQALDIAFSRLVFINPPGTDAPRPYPGQYTYPDLASVNVKSYRHFYAAGQDSAAIVFDHEHTLFTPGATATLSFRLTDSSPDPWRGVTVQARLATADGRELTNQTLPQHLDLSPGGAPAVKAASFQLPQDPGLYRAEVRLIGEVNQLLAANSLEVAVNSLPHSLMIFCAHEDDEGSWDGMIRAAVENHVPIHFLYFTSGDAGSCDRYYEQSCGPAEALNFGEVRMQETRAVLGHLGVPAADILFLGLPDGGSGEIWYHHPSAADPYLATLLASDHSPYRSLVVPNLPYARDSVVEAAAGLIRRFSPEVIVTAHPPQEGHIDHIVNNYFVVKALQELARQGTLPARLKLLVDRVYNPKEHPATPYRYEDRVFHVSGEAAALAQEAGWYYQSQGGNRAEGNLHDLDQLPREMRYREVLDWDGHEGWNLKEPQSPATP
ncbi:MAG TPA: PIG-L family deacetylase [Terriglobia bacterium]